MLITTTDLIRAARTGLPYLESVAAAMTRDERDELVGVFQAVARVLDNSRRCPGCDEPVGNHPTQTKWLGRQGWHTRCYYGPNGGRDR